MRFKDRVIRCGNCLTSKYRCSFSDAKWDIDSWPTLKKTAEGDARRALANEKKKASALQKGSQGTQKKVAKGSGRPVRAKKVPARLRDDSQTPSVAEVQKSGGVPAAARPTIVAAAAGPSMSPDLLSGLVGRMEGLVLESLPRFEEALLSESRTSLTVSNGLAEAVAARDREAAQLEILSRLVKTRHGIFEDLITRMEVESTRLAILEGDILAAAVIRHKAVARRATRNPADPLSEEDDYGELEEGQEGGADRGEGSSKSEKK